MLVVGMVVSAGSVFYLVIQARIVVLIDTVRKNNAQTD
jgi:hypothetical protein